MFDLLFLCQRIQLRIFRQCLVTFHEDKTSRHEWKQQNLATSLALAPLPGIGELN